MKKTLFLLAVIFTASFAVATAQTYQPPDSQQQLSVGQAYENQQVSGIVDKVDIAKKSVTIRNPTTNETTDYAFSSATIFSKGDQSAKPEDLKKGDRISLEVDSMDRVVRLSIKGKMGSSSNSDDQKSKPEKPNQKH